MEVATSAPVPAAALLSLLRLPATALLSLLRLPAPALLSLLPPAP